MEDAKITDNKNDKDHIENNEDFMDEDKIQQHLQDRMKKNRDNMRSTAQRTIWIGNKEKKIQDMIDEGNPAPWIEPDEKGNHEITSHGQSKHEFTHRHMEPVDKQGKYACNTLTDKWFEWFLKTPSSISSFTNPSQSYEDTSLLGGRNAFLFQENEPLVYFAAASPFQDPDIRTITMLHQTALLVPVYNMSASPQDHPNKTTEMLNEIISEDLSGVIQLRAWFDRNPIEGCCVLRQKPLRVTNIPGDNVIGIPEDRLSKPDNSIETCHGGYWLLIRKEKLIPGDHLLEFMAYSKNYEMAAKILINVLA
jgi:hypothetical protein